MKEIKGDILNEMFNYDFVCVTTNGILRNNGYNVMGAGVAKAFRDKFRGIDKLVGQKIREKGNIVNCIMEINGCTVLTFPTKHHWKDKSDIKLIKQSAVQLMRYLNISDKNVLLPRPGCSNGGLNWERDVRPVLEEILDDRVTIISKED